MAAFLHVVTTQAKMHPRIARVTIKLLELAMLLRCLVPSFMATVLVRTHARSKMPVAYSLGRSPHHGFRLHLGLVPPAAAKQDVFRL